MEVVMEEKERYEWGYNEKVLKHYILDTEKKEQLGYKEIFDLLNQQDKRIKELEEENLSLQEQSIRDNQNWIEETTQLKQSQNQVAISELEKIYNLFEPYENSQKDTILCANNGISFIDYLENQIKSLKGEE